MRQNPLTGDIWEEKKEDDDEDVLAVITLNFRVGGEHVETNEECVGFQRGSQRDIRFFLCFAELFACPLL